MKTDLLQDYLNAFWDNEIVPALVDYIRIPCKSPAFDSEWESAGYIDEALELALKWLDKHRPADSTVRVERVPGRTPLILVEIPGETEGSVLMYGHLDKQPEMEGWREDLGPWSPVLEDGRLYGRGSADDGYALFASIGIVKALREQGKAHPRIVIMIEFSEESGSPDLPYYIDALADRIGNVDLVICLDSGAGNYEQFWNTVSLRGTVSCSVKVSVLKEGVHSGSASGLVPSSFRVLRSLLSRIEDEMTGLIKLPELHAEIPGHRLEEVRTMIDVLGGKDEPFPYEDGMQPSTDDPVEGILRRTWKPALSVIGMDGVPPVKDGGNVLRPFTALKLSMRIPPTVDADSARDAMEKVLVEDPPYGATVEVDFEETATGWHDSTDNGWLGEAISGASEQYFGRPAMAMSEGGSIPFMSMLSKRYSQAEFVITGVLGPGANAHGPNEFLHVPFAKKLSAAIAYILSRFPEK